MGEGITTDIRAAVCQMRPMRGGELLPTHKLSGNKLHSSSPTLTSFHLHVMHGYTHQRDFSEFWFFNILTLCISSTREGKGAINYFVGLMQFPDSALGPLTHCNDQKPVNVAYRLKL